LRDVERCRTAALGGHLHVCPTCGYQVPVYNSCRNRHCPACQALAEARWVAAREQVLLPVGHHHVVFTLPAPLRALTQRAPRAVLGLLCAAVNQTLATLAREILHATVGVTAVVHTWTRDLRYHPHVHCLVTAGGLTTNGVHWVERTAYLFPVQRLRARFRARLLAALHRLVARGELPLAPAEWADLERRLPAKNWVVYTEAPFGRSSHVLRYLGRYTHRVAITDSRLRALDGTRVRFVTRDQRCAELSVAEFTARFLQHILPAGLRKIRHYGLYAPGAARRRHTRARELLGDGDRPLESPAPPPLPPPAWDALVRTLGGDDPLRCPQCHAGTPLQRIALPRRAPAPPAPCARPP
jgi:hypothetical protein